MPDPETFNRLRVDKDLQAGSVGSPNNPISVLSFGETVTPPPDADLTTFIPNNAGKVIDLAGQTFTVDSTLIHPNQTEVRNGYIKPEKNIDKNSWDGSDHDWVYRTDPNIDAEGITIRNLRIGPRRANTVSGIQINNSLNALVDNCYFEGQFWGPALAFAGKSSAQGEWAGPRVSDCHFQRCRMEINGRDYMTVSNCAFANQAKLTFNGDNNRVVGSTFSGGGQTMIEINAQANRVIGCEINHTQTAVRATGVERAVIRDNEMILHDSHAVVLDGCIRSTVANNRIGKAGVSSDGDGVYLISDAGACERNNIHNNDLGVHGGANDPGGADPDNSPETTRYAVNEADAGATNNRVKDNVDYDTAQGFFLNSTQTGNESL